MKKQQTKYGRVPSSARKLSVAEGDFRWQVGRSTIVVWGPLVDGQGPKRLTSVGELTGRYGDVNNNVAVPVEPHHVSAYVMRGFEPLKPAGFR